MNSKKVFRYFLFIFLFGFLTMIILGYKIFSRSDAPINNEVVDMDLDDEHIPLDQEMHDEDMKANINEPIIVWWTPFTGESGSYKRCGKVKCFFTVKRIYINHPMTSAFMFYGSDFAITDLPFPRNPDQEWALLHEESPKNNYLFSHADVMTLFNYTCTFKRQSSYPITTQYLYSLDWLMSKDYVVTTAWKNKHRKELAPLMYAHSDCDVPSDRDHYVQMLQKYLNVDSYGKCLHNKELPEHLQDPIEGMDHKDFYKLTAKYKFSLAMENGICDDYITEKLWRPLMVGSVPIVMGSPKIKDFLPSNKSAIIVDDFSSVEKLVEYLDFLDKNDAEYNKYLEWKDTGIANAYLQQLMNTREWSLDNGEHWAPEEINFIDGFECHVCKSIHENSRRRAKGEEIVRHIATVDHYGCPMPHSIDETGQRINNQAWLSRYGDWQDDWRYNRQMAKVARNFIDKNQTFTKAELVRKIRMDE